MRVLLYKWKVFNQADIKSAIERLGHEVHEYEEPEAVMKGKEYLELADVIKEYDVVFSLNYFIRVSNACMAAGRKYIAWTVDSPMISMYDRSAFNSCNYMFVFDKFDYIQFKAMGLENVYYMPLAVDTKRLDNLIGTMTAEERIQYSGDVAFVGGLYHKNSYDKIYDSLPEYLRGYFDAALLAQMDIFGENIFDRMLTVDILAQLSECVEFNQENSSLSDIKLVFTNTFLGFKLAQLERIECLNRLAASGLNVDLYTDKPHEVLKNVKLCGTVSYQQEMPKVFNCHKINLNFTIRNIRSGLPLRIWDILGSGGFLLTNFQAELPAYFENGKDVVYYESLDDMCRKAEYYLAHDEERAAIATSGHEKVKMYHSYDDRIAKMFECASKS